MCIFCFPSVMAMLLAISMLEASGLIDDIAFFLSVQLQSIRISVLSSEIYLFRGKPDTTHVYHLESGRPR